MAIDLRDFPEVFTSKIENGSEIWNHKDRIATAEMERLCAERPDFYSCEERHGRRVMILCGFENDHYYEERPVQDSDETIMVMRVTPQGLRNRL
jgi:hypothetical protein